MKIIEFETQILPTDADIPKSDDPRLKPMLQQLVDAGVMAPDGSGTCLVPSVKMRRGMSPPNNWIWRFEWEEAAMKQADR